MATNTDSSSSRMDWTLFIVFLIPTLFFLWWKAEWFWVPLPFTLTYLVRALKVM